MIYEPIRKEYPPEVEFYKRYFHIPAEKCVSYFYGAVPENEMDVYVITFNNPFMVEYQIKTLRRFLKTPFNLIIVDNNNWMYDDVSREILALCIAEKVTYLKAPDNFYQLTEHFDPTMKLGTTINWLYVNCVKQRKPRYFGFLDHDCFLIRDMDLRPYLDKNGMYGKVVRSKADSAWTLHVTTNFYKLDFLQGRLLDWRASYAHQMDTGGANYDILYKDHDPDRYDLENHTFRFDRQDVNRKDSVQHYELIDHSTWFHMCASSHDQLVGDGAYKLAYTKGYLDSRLQRG